MAAAAEAWRAEREIISFSGYRLGGAASSELCKTQE
jgi:hypothetical protein